MVKCAVFVAYYRGLKLNFCGEENFAGGKFREIPLTVDIIFAGGKFRAKSKFANIAKISSTRKIGVIQYIKMTRNPLVDVSTSFWLRNLLSVVSMSVTIGCMWWSICAMAWISDCESVNMTMLFMHEGLGWPQSLQMVCKADRAWFVLWLELTLPKTSTTSLDPTHQIR